MLLCLFIIFMRVLLLKGPPKKYFYNESNKAKIKLPQFALSDFKFCANERFLLLFYY